MDGLDHLGAEPQDVTAVELGDGNGEQAAGILDVVERLREFGRQRVGAVEFDADGIGEPVDDGADLGFLGCGRL